MSSEKIEERIVQMKFDNKQFEENMKESSKSLDKFNKSLELKNASKGLEEVGRAAKGLNFSSLTSSLSLVGQKFSALQVAGITAIANITNSAVNAGKRIAKSLTIDPIKTGFSEYETQINAVQTIMSNTRSKGTTLDQVNNALDQLNTYADQTIYNFTEMTRNIGTFTAAGIDLDTSVSAIKGIANLAAVSGSTSQQASTAMYQLSQALSSGTVKLQDWNSVVNAGMGGQIFQDALKETARIHGKNVDQMIKDEGSFRESLKNGWITSEILTETLAKFTGDLTEEQLKQMGYTDKQIKQIVDMGNDANEAATKVKTFTQLFDTLKEAAQSGWTSTWEILIGDFEEAKKLLTEISNKFGAIIGRHSEKRNSMLETWKELGGRDSLIESARNLMSSFSKVFEIFNNNLKYLTKWKDDLFTSEMRGKALLEVTKKLETHTKKVLTFIEDHSDEIDNIFWAFESVVQVIQNVFDSLKKSINEVFGKDLENTSSLFKNLFSWINKLAIAVGDFNMRIANSSNIEKVFIKIFKIVKTVSIFAFSIFKKIFDYVVIAKNKFLEFKKIIEDNGTAIKDKLYISFLKVKESIDKVKESFSSLSETFKFIYSTIKEKLSSLKDILFDTFNNDKLDKKIDSFTVFSTIVDALTFAFSKLGNAISKVFLSISKYFNIETLSKVFGKIGSVLKNLWKIITVVGKSVIDVLANIAKNFTDVIGSDSGGSFLNTLLDLINGGILTSILLGIRKFTKGFGNSFKGLETFGKNIKNILDSIGGCFEAYQNKIKADSLHSIAVSIAILAGSIFLLAMIDENRLLNASMAISALFAELVGSMKMLNKIPGGYKSILNVSGMMMSMAISISILSLSLGMIANISQDNLTKGLLTVGALMAMLVASSKLMSSNKKVMISGLGSLISFSIAIRILASSVKELGKLDLSEIGKGLLGVVSLIAAIGIFVSKTNSKGGLINAGLSMIAFSIAIKILTSSIKTLGEMDLVTITKGGIAVSGMLLAIAGAIRLMGSPKNIISASLGMLIMVQVLKQLIPVISDLGSIKLDVLAKGIGAIAFSLAAFAGIMHLLPKNLIKIGIGLIAIATSFTILASGINIISKSIEKIGQMDFLDVVQGVGSIVILITLMAAAMKIVGNKAIGFAAGFSMMATSLLMLIPSLIVLSSLSWESLGKIGAALAGIFAIFGVAAFILKPLLPVILGLSAALFLIGASVAVAGAGVIALGTGLIVLSTGLTAVSAVAAVTAETLSIAIRSLLKSIIDMIPYTIIKLGEGIVALIKFLGDSAKAIGKAIVDILLSILGIIIDSVPKIAKAIIVIINSLMDVIIECTPKVVEAILTFLDVLLSRLTEYAPKLVDSLFDIIIKVLDGIAKKIPELIKSAIGVLMSFFKGVSDAMKQIDVNVLLDGIKGIGLLSAIMASLSLIAPFIPGALAAVVGMTAVVAELSLALSAIGALSKIPGIFDIINDGGNLLEAIGTALGKFIGGIAGGIMNGISSQFPKIGTDLSNFMINATPFIDGASRLDPGMLDGAKALAEVILLLTAADIVKGLTSWLTGGNSLSSFAEELVPFGKAMKQYSEEVKGIDGEIVSNSAIAGKTLAEMAATLPNKGGLVGWFTGENDMEEFGRQLIPFGRAMVKFSKELKGLDSDVITDASTAGKTIAEMAATLPNTGGVVGWFTGENDIDKFGEKLIPFGRSIKRYSEELKGLDSKVIDESVVAGKAIAEMAKLLPNTGGAVSWFTGDNDIGTFGEKLIPFGRAIKDYSENIKGIDGNAISNSAMAGKSLVELADALPNTGGVVSWFAGDNDIGKFGESLISFGKNFASYSDYMSTVDSGIVRSTTDAASSLVALQRSLPEDGGWFSDETTLKDFGSDMLSFGKNFYKFYDSVDDIDSNKLNSVTKNIKDIVYIANIASQVNNKELNKFTETLKNMSNDGVNSFIDSFDKSKLSANRAVSSFFTSMNDEVLKQQSGVNLAFSTVVGFSISTLYSKEKSFKLIGNNLIDGLISGIIEKSKKVLDTVKDIGSRTAQALRDSLGIKSPSKVFAEIGKYVDDGFALGIENNSDEITKSLVNINDDTVSKMSDIIKDIYALSSDEFENNPIITPVVDMTNIKTSSREIDEMLSRRKAYNISGNMIGENANNSANRNISYTFNQNNYSPKALSRIEIYRQTKNQFNAFERRPIK